MSALMVTSEGQSLHIEDGKEWHSGLARDAPIRLVRFASLPAAELMELLGRATIEMGVPLTDVTVDYAECGSHEVRIWWWAR